MNRLNNLIRLTDKQAKTAGKMLVRAFYDYPSVVHTFPNIDEKTKKLPKLFEFMVCFGIKYGEVYSTSKNVEAVAVWLPYWEAEMTGEREMNLDFPELGEEYNKRHEPIAKCEKRCHKQYANFFHWYLFPIGVDPVYQGKGYASILLRTKLTQFDKLNVPCYLETSSKKNVEIYQHFGFEIVEYGIIPKTDVPYWAMLRK
jgi:ribosomal protein S18 acetylase RimI-like enzyme